jgi:molecular chaperone DnaK
MIRTTIDFGIDLGTTNSAIAVLKGVSPEIIKNNRDQDITPSAVGYSKNGAQQVGEAAKGMFVGVKDAYIEFKRRMGTDFVYSFAESGLKKKPEDLSSEILKSLRADVERSTGELLHSAVITVPAAFELHQCDATRKAAELAGLIGSPLLQEPVAAALAYGFQANSEKAYWLVYDFGGGTFDAALIKAEEGIINVVHHGGDMLLGGSDIDWAVLEKIIAPSLACNYDLPDFKRGNDRWKLPLRKLKHFIEIAKIELTTKESASLFGCTFEDAGGHEVDCDEITLTRSQLVSVAQPIINKSISICRQVLKEKNLSAENINKVILVGGPTKAPYFRELLRDTLGIPIDFSVDPLTVVAKGAAVFAGTQKVDPKKLKPAQAGEFRVDLKYKPVGHELDPLVGGKVSSVDGLNVEGFVLEFVNQTSQWRSGKMTLRSDGAFMLNLLAEKGSRNTFILELCDSTGTKQNIVPDNLNYTQGSVVDEQPLINSMGVALETNEVAWFFKKGMGLPQKKRYPKTYRTTKAIKATEEGTAILIPIVEGEKEVADRNRRVGALEIKSSMIKRDLPEGSEVEITLKIDESRVITTNIYVPLLDEEFEEILDLRKDALKSVDIESDFEREKARLQALKNRTTDEKIKNNLDGIQSSELMAEIKEALAAAKGDVDAAAKAEKRLLELKLILDAIEDSMKLPSAISELRKWLSDLNRLASEHASEDQKDRAADIVEEANEAITEKVVDRIEKQLRNVQDLYYQILFSINAFWVQQFQHLEKEKPKMQDKAKADRLLDMGRKYLDQNNPEGLRNVVTQLWELLPKQLKEQVQRGFGANLRL